MADGLSTDTLIVAERLTKHYGPVLAVDHISFSVMRGEVLGMLGPNGAGKTTTLRMLTGLVRPTSGRVMLAGYDLAQDRARALAATAAIMEESRFYSYLSGLENLRQVARMRNLDHDDRALARHLAAVELDSAARRPVRQYSLGMRQRLALAAALMTEPDVLILDEPMNGLDPAAIKDLRDRLRDLARQGVAMVLSSHLLAEVELLADRVIVIEQGRQLDEEAAPEIEELAVRLTVGDVEGAREVLGAAAEPLGPRELGITLLEEAIPALVTRLVAADIAVYAVVPSRASLESRYLARTGHKRAGGSGKDVS